MKSTFDSSIMKRMRPAGNVGSAGTYLAPVLRTARIDATSSARWRMTIPTERVPSGKLSAIMSVIADSSAKDIVRPSSMIAGASD